MPDMSDVEEKLEKSKAKMIASIVVELASSYARGYNKTTYQQPSPQYFRRQIDNIIKLAKETK